jgi:hypothetical protein
MIYGLIFCPTVDIIIVYIKIFCPNLFKTSKSHFRIKKGYMELELHLKFSTSASSHNIWRFDKLF